MLGKLCKHEIRATARYFLPLFLITLVLTPITRFTVSIGNFPGILGFIPAVVIFAYVASIIVIVAASVLLIVQRFYKSMVTEEGYLMHTLPVSVETHIFAKLIIASLWEIASIIVVLISLVMMFFTPERFSSFWQEISELWRMAGVSEFVSRAQVSLMTVETIILFLVATFTAPLIFYASIALGQVLSKNKILGSIAGFFIIQFVSQILGAISLFPFSYAMNSAQSLNSIQSQVSVVANVFFPYCIAISLVSGAVLFLLTDFIFKKKLNLE